MKHDYLGCKNRCSKKVLSIIPSGDGILITYDDGTYTTASKDVLAKELTEQADKGALFDPTSLESRLEKLETKLTTIQNGLVGIQDADGVLTHKAFNKNFNLGEQNGSNPNN